MKASCAWVLAVLLLSGCQSPQLERPLDSAGTVRVSLSTANGRTVVADLASQVASVIVSMESNDGYASPGAQTISSPPWLASFPNIRAGSWNLTATVRNAEGLEIGSGQATGQLDAGATLNVPITIIYGSAASAGSVLFTVAFPTAAGINSVSATLVETAANSAPSLTDTDGTSRAVLVLPLPAGIYTLVITFARSGTTAGTFREKAVVQAGLTSASWVAADGTLVGERSFATGDFFHAPVTDISALTATTGVASVTLTWLNPPDSDFGGVRVETFVQGSSALVNQQNVAGSPAAPGTVTISGLVTSTPYTFNLKAYDGSVFSSGVGYWACTGGPSQADFVVSGGQITGYTGSSTSLVLPSEINGQPVTSIATSAFANNLTITSVTIPSSVTSIPSNAFINCTSLTSVNLPETLQYLFSQAFMGCTQLASVTIPPSVQMIDMNVFWGCTSLTSLTIPPSVKSIGQSAFMDTGLTSLDIPPSISAISYSMLRDCANLSAVTIPDTIKSIDGCAFSMDYSLTSIRIPSSVNSIGEQAFLGCTKLTSFTIDAEDPPVLGSRVFESTPLQGIYVPYSSDHHFLTSYQEDDAWKEYYSLIQEQPP